MFSILFGYLFNFIYSVFEWFSLIVSKMGATDWVIVSIVFAIGIRFILVPLTGGRFSSDVARGIGSARRNAKYEERRQQIKESRQQFKRGG